jgi:hypothetical protein
MPKQSGHAFASFKRQLNGNEDTANEAQDLSFCFAYKIQETELL